MPRHRFGNNRRQGTPQTMRIISVMQTFYQQVIYDIGTRIQQVSIERTKRDTGLSKASYRWTIGRNRGQFINRGDFPVSQQVGRRREGLTALRNWRIGDPNPHFTNDVEYILHAITDGAIEVAILSTEARINAKYGGDNPQVGDN